MRNSGWFYDQAFAENDWYCGVIKTHRSPGDLAGRVGDVIGLLFPVQFLFLFFQR
jgi:hypothetical protein